MESNHEVAKDAKRPDMEIRPLLGRVRIDGMVLTEDLTYKNGPHLSPKIFEEFWLPYQNPIVQEVKRHGTGIVCLWTAGKRPFRKTRVRSLAFPGQFKVGQETLLRRFPRVQYQCACSGHVGRIACDNGHGVNERCSGDKPPAPDRTR